MAVNDHEDMSLREGPLLKLVLETLVTGPKWTHRPLPIFQCLQPIHLLLSLDFLFSFHARASLLGKHVLIGEALLFDWHRDRVKLHVIVVALGPVNTVHCEKLIGPLGPSSRYGLPLAAIVLNTIPLVPNHIQEVVMVLWRLLPFILSEMVLKVLIKVVTSNSSLSLVH